MATHKPQVYIDLSGWSPKYFPPILVQYANTLLKDKILFGSDYPVMSPERWMADFDKLQHQARGAAADSQNERGEASPALTGMSVRQMRKRGQDPFPLLGVIRRKRVLTPFPLA